jgi:hypothetical protein
MKTIASAGKVVDRAGLKQAFRINPLCWQTSLKSAIISLRGPPEMANQKSGPRPGWNPERGPDQPVVGGPNG